MSALSHLEASKGCHFPSLSYVEYKGKINNENREALRAELQQQVDELLQTNSETHVFYSTKENLPKGGSCSLGQLNTVVSEGLAMNGKGLMQTENEVATVAEKVYDKQRVVFVGGELGCFCGGTHVKETDDIGRIQISKIQYKKKVTKVTYSIENSDTDLSVV